MFLTLKRSKKISKKVKSKVGEMNFFRLEISEF